MPPFWHPYGMSRPLGIGLTILAFALKWQIGLAVLFFMLMTKRMGCRRWGQQGQNQGYGPGNSGGNGGWQAPWGNWSNWGGGGNRGNQTPPTSGNHAFDEYRAETLRRLEEEQTEFSSFLERLRFAKDKAEFDQFMAERQRPRPPTVPDEPAHG
jgi:hypothetical protein